MIIFKVRYDTGGGKKSLGARFGPGAIERAFLRWDWRGAEDGTPHPKLLWVTPFASSLEGYRRKAKSVFAQREGLESFIVLSGDNSCSFETVRAVAQHVKGNVALAILDAHLDACAPGHDPHATWVRRLWDEGIVAPDKTVFFGIRDAENNEALYVKEKNGAIVTPDEIYAAHAGKYYTAPSTPRSVNWDPVSAHSLIIVVDIDVLDPAYAPGTGVLRAGGLHVRHVLHIIRKLCALPFAVKIGEICEVIPEEGNNIRPQFDKRPDPCGLTVLAAEAIFREMIRSIST